MLECAIIISQNTNELKAGEMMTILKFTLNGIYGFDGYCYHLPWRNWQDSLLDELEMGWANEQAKGAVAK